MVVHLLNLLTVFSFCRLADRADLWGLSFPAILWFVSKETSWGVDILYWFVKKPYVLDKEPSSNRLFSTPAVGVFPQIAYLVRQMIGV